jgi:hypothetical protein
MKNVCFHNKLERKGFKMKRKLVLGFVVLLVFGFSAVSVWAQTNNNPVRLTISGIDGFNGWDGGIYLSTSNDPYDDEAFVASNDGLKITAGSATGTLTSLYDDKPFTRSGRYYVFLQFYTVVNRSERFRFFVSKNLINITGGSQHIVFSYDTFVELDL